MSMKGLAALLCGRTDECERTGKGVRAVKTDGVQVFEDDGIMQRTCVYYASPSIIHLSPPLIQLHYECILGIPSLV